MLEDEDSIDHTAVSIDGLAVDIVDVVERACWDKEDRNIIDGLFAIADSIRYLADTIGACPVKDIGRDLTEALREMGGSS